MEQTNSTARARLARKEDFLTQLQDFLNNKPDGKWCVAAIDVEHFKLYNEWYGVARGDQLLEDLAICVGKAQASLGCPVGYFGNDDFFLCLPDNADIIETLHKNLQSCVNSDSNNVNFYIVLGLCSADVELHSARTLCNYAQIAAMSHSAGTSYICRFDSSMLERLRQRQELLTEVERGMQNHEFCFFLQPKCNSMTQRIIGMEALVRWKHPTRGYVSPGEFIPLLEQTGQVTQLDMYIWESVCQTLHRWQQEGRNIVPISVNVSISDISTLNVGQVFSNLVEKYELEPKFVSVEITESMMAQNIELVQNTILALHRKGFTVLMDDFGSGYSSLNMLKDTSVDVLKLDMKFVDLTPENRDKGTQIVESVVDMAHRLNMPVVAEGVETQEQVYMLQSMDCLYTQGYFFYKPMEVAAAEKLLTDRPSSEGYWDLRRDMMLRDHRVFGNKHVSEQTAAALQTFQILGENALELSRLNLLTGEYSIIKRSPRLAGTGMENAKTFEEYCNLIIEQGAIPASFVDKFRIYTDLKFLRNLMFVTQRPLSTRFRGCTPDGTPSPVIAAVLPCKDCSEQNPWAAVVVFDMPETSAIDT